MTGSEQAIAGAGAVLHASRAERDELAAAGGAEAVARWAAPHCTEAEKVALAAYWAGLVQEPGGETAA
jgi:hypothetical protein